MSTIIGGSSPSITFSDSTTQASAGLTAASPTIASGVLTYPNGATNGGYINGGTAVASTSGTAITFTGIPSWVKRVTVMFNGVSVSSTSNIQIQIGAGSLVTTGYTGGTSTGTTVIDNSTGFIVARNPAASNVYSGVIVLVTLGSFIWAESGNVISSASDACTVSAGNLTLSGALDRVSVTTTGADTFDAGSINILYE